MVAAAPRSTNTVEKPSTKKSEVMATRRACSLGVS